MRRIQAIGQLLLSCLAALYLPAAVGQPQSQRLPVLEFFPPTPLIGWAPISESLLFVSQDRHLAGISAQALISSAKENRRFVEELKLRGELSQSRIGVNEWYRTSSTIADVYQPAVPYSPSVASANTSLDTNFSVSVVDTELFRNSRPSVFKARVADQQIDFVRVDFESAVTLRNAYRRLESTSGLSPAEVQSGVRHATATLSSAPRMAAAVERTLGKVSFGQPLAQPIAIATARRKGPATDIYLLHLAITVSDARLDDVSDLTLGVEGPSGTLALDLIPFRFSKDAQVKEIASSPTLKISIAGVGEIEIGQFYSRETVFVDRRPTLLAGGIQESNYWWKLEGDALQAGSHRFVAVMQVPTGKKVLVLQMQVVGTTKGGLITQSKKIFTSPKVVEVQLR